MSVCFVPYGRKATEALREAIAAAKGRDALSPVTVITPSNHASLSLRRSLGRTGTAPGAKGLVNISFVRLSRLTELLGAPLLASRGKTPLTPALEAEAVRASLAAAGTGFEAVRDHPGTARSLTATMRDLRHADDAALETLRRSGARARAVVTVFREFHQRTKPFYDEHDLALAAAQAVSSGSKTLDEIGCVILFLPRPLTPAETAFAQALRATGRLTVLIGLTGDEEVDKAPRQMAALLGKAPGGEAPAPDAFTESIISAPDAQEEARSILRVIVKRLEGGMPLHRMAVLYRHAEPYSRLLQEQFRSTGIPFSSGSSRTLGQSVTGRTLLGLLRLKEEDFRRDRVVEWLSGAPIVDGSGSRVPAHRWNALACEAGVVKGASQWQERLGALAYALDLKRKQPAVENEETRRAVESDMADCQRASRFIEQLASQLSAPPLTSWEDMSKWARALLGDYLVGSAGRSDWPDAEHEADQRVLQALDSLAVLDALETPPDEAAFLQAVEREMEASDGPAGKFGEGVFIGSLRQAVGCEFDLVFVVGMVEGAMPPALSDDPLLQDSERGPAGLPVQAARRVEETREYLSALAAAPERIFLYPRADLRSQREQMPGVWLTGAASRMAGKRIYSSDFRTNAAWFREVPSFEWAVRNDTRCCEQEYTLRSLLQWRGCGEPLQSHYLCSEQPVLATGFGAEADRLSERFTRWDGMVDTASGWTLEASPVSPSALERWAVCPFRYFMTYRLNVRAPEEPEDELTIQAVDKGNLLHSILQQFFTEVEPRTSPDHAWTREERARLAEICDEQCARLYEAGKAGNRCIWRHQTREMASDLLLFLDEDEAYRKKEGVIPFRVEADFGNASEAPTTITLSDGRPLAVRGRPDRVDRSPDGRTVVVIDYKTGKADKFSKPETRLATGQLLQLPLYAHGEREQVPGARVAGYYWMITSAGRFKREGYWVEADVEARLDAALLAIRDGIDGGLFPMRPGEFGFDNFNNCRYCDFDSVCPAERGRAWERKKTDQALAGYVALCEPPPGP